MSYNYNNSVEISANLFSTIKLWNGDSLITEKIVKTDNNGEYSFEFGNNLPLGTYYFEISLDRNSSVIPNSKIFEFKIIDSSSPESLQIVVGLFLIAVLSVIGLLIFKKHSTSKSG